MLKTMPAIFFGHGNPLNTLPENIFTRGWSRIGSFLPRPRAVLCVSAHWYVPETAVTASASPPTIHDFSGFPQQLYDIAYPAPGDPGLAGRVRDLLSPLPVDLDEKRGLDHGTWTVLRHVFPEADVPVVQLSIDRTKPAQYHFDLGKQLAPLRDEGVLIAGSGNIVHNLYLYSWERSRIVKPFDWAERFESNTREFLISGDYDSLVNYGVMGNDALLSIPNPDHYLPLLYIAALRRQGEQVSFPLAGFDGGSISMLCVRFG